MKILRRDEIARKNRYRQHGRLVGFKTPERKVPDNAPGSVIGYFAFWRLKSYQPTMLTVTVFARYFVPS